MESLNSPTGTVIPSSMRFRNQRLPSHMMPLGQIALVRPATGPAVISHLDRENVVVIEANTQGKSLGEVDLAIAVQDTFPLRLTASFDNTGNAIIGRNRYTAAVSYANLWGRDHQVSYQFSTTDHQRVYRAHGLSYQAPLPWRHRFEASFNYLTVNPIFFNGLFNQKGKNVVASMRYTLPLGGNNRLHVLDAVLHEPASVDAAPKLTVTLPARAPAQVGLDGTPPGAIVMV